MPRKTFVMSTAESGYLADMIAYSLDINNRLSTDRRTFGDGEHYYRIEVGDQADLVGNNVVIVGSTHSDDATHEIYRIGCALANYGTRRRIFVNPFFGYSTMERAVHAGEVVTAKTQARHFSSIPNSGLGNIFLLLDTHSEGLVHYFEGDCVRMELHAEELLKEEITKLGLSNFMFASADLGRPRLVQRLAAHFKTNIALISKTRSFEETKILDVIGDVTGKDVIIYDDMTRSAKTLVDAAKAYLARGATSVYAVLSHFALNNPGVVDVLVNSPIVKVITTNSHPMSQQVLVHDSDKFVVTDVSDLFATTIRRIVGMDHID